MATKKRKARKPKKRKALTSAQRLAKARVHVATSRKIVRVAGYTRGYPKKKRPKKR